MQLRINSILEESIVDGPGLRYVIYTQGCDHHCPACHNPQTHDRQGGMLMDCDALLSQIAEDPLLQGVTFSGGEPFLQAGVLAELAKKIHALKLDVVTYTGYTLEALLDINDPDITALLTETDILIDGPYDHSQRDLSLQFRGSRNQRIISL
ncbi:anaerobic ribonucleoside-triphosphate reductase activating protein [Acetobacterium bakii]|uniref:anaerobic ribonucleoside-triphosphate reductase activating protein n=1 Tax=Acetobacterium bakii TaxID=52689 RepID=UPI001FA6FCF0|nr:anaerobic ribonucleoside-triphosphate reductase activating protein [Acetobacterium bakii]